MSLERAMPASRANQAVSELVTATRIDARCAIVSPHPDDETIGVGGALWRIREPVIICLTDGAPLDPRFWPAKYANRETYASVRKRELYAALAAAGVSRARVRCLGCMDQNSVFQIPQLVSALQETLLEERPDIVIVTPYEGGHPDHDCAALASQIALQNLRNRNLPAPALVEMASYHSSCGQLEYGGFLSGCAGVERPLTPEDQVRKRRMLEAYASQAATLCGVGMNVERFRAAPDYDFTKPPHRPPLHYEKMGWPMTSDQFCQLATLAFQALGLAPSLS